MAVSPGGVIMRAGSTVPIQQRLDDDDDNATFQHSAVTSNHLSGEVKPLVCFYFFVFSLAFLNTRSVYVAAHY